ncbi:MAG: hypothetical protein AB7P12_15705, partial [Alphaproteobacteria bacterium]
MQAMLRQAELALALGRAMIEAVAPIREDLITGFSPDARADGMARRYASDLLDSPLTVGISNCTREGRNRELSALLDAGR